MKKTLLFTLIILVVLVLILFFYISKKAEAPIVVTPTPVATSTPIIEILPMQAGLPTAVEAKRQAIFNAAKSRDYEKLNAETGPNFNVRDNAASAHNGNAIAIAKLNMAIFDVNIFFIRL